MVAEIAPILTALYGFYNLVFQPLMATGPYISLGFFSVALAAIFSLIYWQMLDIERQKEIKEKLEKRQEKMKEARKEGEQEKASEHMQKTMELNQKMMRLNIKPMLGTMVFVALFFPWLGSTFAPQVGLAQTSPVMFEGNFTYAGNTVPVTVDNSTENLTVSVDGQKTSVGEKVSVFGVDWDVKNFGEHTGGFFAEPKGHAVKLSASFIDLPFSIPFVGDELNWLGFYILFAMPLTFVFRKLLGVA